MDSKAFDATVAAFYRAATGAVSWQEPLDSVQAMFGARAAVLQSADRLSGTLLGVAGGGPPIHEALLEYLRSWHHAGEHRPYVLARAPLSIGLWWHCHEHFDEHFVANDRFYQDFLPAYDMRYVSAQLLMPSEQVMSVFALELPDSRGPLDADEREVIRRLGHHAREALHMHERVRQEAAQTLAGHGLLQAFAYPMWLIDADRFVFFANLAAQAESAAEGRVAQRGSRLVLRKSAADRALGDKLRPLLDAGHGAKATIALHGGDAEAPVWLHLTVLLPGAALGAFGARPTVLATLFDTARVRPLDPFALVSMFGLTPTEAKVAALLADGLTAPEIARANRSKEPTVRTQIRKILAKLRARRIADAVRLLRQGEALWAQAGVEVKG